MALPQAPTGFRPLSFDDLNRLSISPENELAWDGRPVVTRLAFSRAQKALAALVAVAAILGGAGSALQGVAAYSVWACEVNWPSFACTQSPSGENGAGTPIAAPAPPSLR